MSKENNRVGDLLFVFLSESLVFCEGKSDLLTVALLQRVTGAIRSCLLFCKVQ